MVYAVGYGVSVGIRLGNSAAADARNSLVRVGRALITTQGVDAVAVNVSGTGGFGTLGYAVRLGASEPQDQRTASTSQATRLLDLVARSASIDGDR